MSKTAPIFRLAFDIQEERDAYRKEANELRSALHALYDAIPTGFGEDRALNEATKQAEKVLGITK